MAVYLGFRDDSRRIFANHYRPGVGWDGAQPISPQEATTPPNDPQVGVDALGNVVAVWSRFSPCSPGCAPLYDVVGRRFDAALGWQEIVTIATGLYGGRFPRVAVDPTGNALAVWDEDSNGSAAGPVFEVWAARLAAGSGWAPAQRLQPQSTGSAYLPVVVLDSAGNGLAAWARIDGKEWIVWAARFLATSGWGQPEAIGTEGAAVFSDEPVALAINPKGDGIAAWARWDGAHYAIWVNRFTAVGSTPPK
jgi:hypothetical protein